MSFTFNKETRRSLRERLRDGINLIPGASSVVQPNNLLDPANQNTIKKIGQTGQQKKAHSVDSTSLLMSTHHHAPDESIKPPPCSPSYLLADNPHHGVADTDSRSGSVSSCSSASSSPSKYRTYVVKNNDTVTSIAASFDCTPSELLRVNRLITARVLFPGQVLKIPNKKTPQQQPEAPVTTQQNDAATASMLETLTYAQRKFLKVKVRHVTDGNGVVCGTLLITPNAVMFDPNVSDPLVIEQGAETYGIILPIEYIVGASIWSDICGMKVRGKETFVPPGPRPVLWGENKVEDKIVEEGKIEEEPVSVDKSEEDENEEPGEESDDTKSRLEQVTEHPLSEANNITTWYFCLTIGRPKHAGLVNDNKGRGRNPLCITYGQKNLVRPEFWFSVSREQVPELYKYWMFWWPHLYGEVDTQVICDRGYEGIDWDNLDVLDSGVGSRSEQGEEEQTMAQELNELTKESWEVVTNEELRNLLAMGGDEMMAINLPELIGGKSEILEEEDIKNITRHLTARAEGYPWTLIFTSSRDGFSLNSLYRRNSLMQEESPVMLLIQDTKSRVFGALVSCSLHTSDSFYGTGQSFLFTLRPEFKLYKWTGENLFFVKGNHDGIWIGAGDGKFGLYVDGDLNCGRTEPCQTYGNGPLTEPEDFIIRTLECWAFGNYVLNVEGTSEAVK